LIDEELLVMSHANKLISQRVKCTRPNSSRSQHPKLS